jgi:hypothetical protein
MFTKANIARLTAILLVLLGISAVIATTARASAPQTYFRGSAHISQTYFRG